MGLRGHVCVPHQGMIAGNVFICCSSSQQLGTGSKSAAGDRHRLQLDCKIITSYACTMFAPCLAAAGTSHRAAACQQPAVHTKISMTQGVLDHHTDRRTTVKSMCTAGG